MPKRVGLIGRCSPSDTVTLIPLGAASASGARRAAAMASDSASSSAALITQLRQLPRRSIALWPPIGDRYISGKAQQQATAEEVPGCRVQQLARPSLLRAKRAAVLSSAPAAPSARSGSRSCAGNLGKQAECACETEWKCAPITSAAGTAAPPTRHRLLIARGQHTRARPAPAPVPTAPPARAAAPPPQPPAQPSSARHAPAQPADAGWPRPITPAPSQRVHSYRRSAVLAPAVPARASAALPRCVGHTPAPLIPGAARPHATGRHNRTAPQRRRWTPAWKR
jgi:hypothetical protein